MKVSKTTAAFLFSIVTFTGEVGTDGNPVRRSAFQARFIRAYNSLRKKIVEAHTQIAIVPSGRKPEELKESDVEWVPNEIDFKAPEGFEARGERFIDGELELTDSEKALVKHCIPDEIPAVSDRELDEFNQLVGTSL